MDNAMLRARLEDAVRLSNKGARYLGFLDPAESAFLLELTGRSHEAKFCFWGGYPEAERCFLAVYQPWEEPDFPLLPITLEYRQEDQLSHRDFLGSFMAQGVARASLGDILTEPGRAVIFVKIDLAAYFCDSVTKVGRVGVRCSPGMQEPLPQAHGFQVMEGVVASERLDCMTAFLLHTSREKAVAAIQAGLVMVNYRETDAVSVKLCQGDIVSVRHSGKFVVDRLGPPTKKGRLSVSCRKYI